ncbi:hypothetical protein KAW80_00745 [Candidatus Babeliales bacterium]|nr:hypothetical protein [Candidatus Babeliales bacterium]
MKQILKFLLLTFLFTVSTNAIDLPTFWRTSMFQGEPGNDIRNGTVYFDVKGSYGSTKSGFNGSGDTTNILNINGLVDVNNLALNLENLTSASKPITYQYLRETSGTIPALNFTGNNGKFELNGKIKTQELAFEARVNAKSGFFGRIHVPLRKVEIKDISIINKTSSDATGASTFQDFLDNHLDTVLSENGLDSITTTFDKESIGDISINIGWEGYGNGNFGVIKSFSGSIAGTLTIPTGPREKLNRVVSVPLGHDGHIGLGVRGNAQAHLSNWFAVGANLGVNVFLSRTTTKRMPTSKDQNGLVLLEQGRAETDPGALWDLGGYLKLDKPFGGFYGIAGYSFTTQESKRRVVKDSQFLYTLIFNQTQAGTHAHNKDDIVNSDQQLKQWNQHILQFALGYDFKTHKSNFAPRFEFFYNYPLFGKRVFKTDMIGGLAGLIMHWDF